MKYYIKVDKLKEEGADFKKFAKEEIDTRVDSLMRLKGNSGWVSPAGEEFDQMYQDMVNKLYDLGGVMEKLGSFMELCSEHYGDVNEKVINDWRAMMDEMDAERKKRMEELQDS